MATSAAPARIRFPGHLYFLLSALKLWLINGDINFTAFSRDPEGKASHMRLLGGSTVDYFSTEFNELCPEVAGPIENPIGITQRFQHPQMRKDPHHDRLPVYRYMMDDQLDNPYAGQISKGEHTQIVDTKAFIPDDDLLVLPHNRTQLCHYAIRLTPPENMANSAVWYRFKQFVAYGFETEFHFRIVHRSRSCIVAGQTSEWCEFQGGDGFAFVIQNEGRKAVGSQVSGMGYAFKKNLVIEFDTEKHSDYGETSSNHISVMIPPRQDQANTANHEQSQIAYTDDIPPLSDGTHAVRIKYQVRDVAWDQLGQAFESDLQGDWLRQQHAGRSGLLTVEIDGRRVIAVPLDINYIVQIDNFDFWRADPPSAPNKTAYDEGGGYPGKAWVGFTSSTNYFQSQSVDILSWTFTEYPDCLDDGATDIMCRINDGTRSRRLCRQDEGDNELCTFIVRNIARQAVLFGARYKDDKFFEATPCSAGKLEWNGLHPYFLGCRMPVSYTQDLVELWITTADGTRTAMLTEPYLLGKVEIPFRRRSLFEYCTLEHNLDPWRLYFAECNCEYCIRLLKLQTYYAVFYQHECTARYSLRCPCFESSEVVPDQSAWTTVEPLRYMRIHICRGCAYPSQCAKMLKVATCETAYQTYIVGNPLAPTPQSNGFQNLNRDEGRITDGKLSGDACVCEPELKPHNGDPEGRSGGCSEAGNNLVEEVVVPDLDGCALKCKSTAKGGFIMFWLDGTCKVFERCHGGYFILCKTQRCYQAYVYEIAPLGPYIDMKGLVQRNRVFPLRAIQTRPEDCFECLRLYDEQYCTAQCGPGKDVSYLHWPSGQSCATCIFAGNRMHEMTIQQTNNVKTCVYEAIRQGQDPWIVCNKTTMANANVPTIDLFNGVATHFLSECPGRPFGETGAVCVPNLYARTLFPSQILSRMAAPNNTVWGPEMQCLNALCHIVPRVSCYERLARWEFKNDYSDSMSYRIQGQAFGSPRRAAAILGSLRLDKDQDQYVVTEPLPFDMENTTLEVWTLVSEVERVTDIALARPIVANSDWRTTYLPEMAVDGNLVTYWSSQIGEIGAMSFEAQWELDLGAMNSVGQVVVTWHQYAADFQMWVSQDNVTWVKKFEMEDNEEALSEINSFFKARYIRLVMTRAAMLRPEGPGEGHPVYSIREFEVFTDDNLSRLKETIGTFLWSRTADLARDGDNETYWATEPGTSSSTIMFDFGSIVSDITVVEVKWRFVPQKVGLYWGDKPCSVEQPTNELQLFSGAQVLPALQDRTTWSGQCFMVLVYQSLEVFGELLTGLAEAEVFAEGINLAENATVYSTYPTEQSGAHTTNVKDALDGRPNTNWLVKTVNGLMTLILNLGEPKLIISVKIEWTVIGLTEYVATRYDVSISNTPSEFVVVDSVSGSFDTSHRFVLYETAQFVKLSVTQIPQTNPQGQVGLKDFTIYAASSNVLTRSTTTAEASSEWSGCERCSLTDDGTSRIHGPDRATDGLWNTWWGAPLGIDNNVYWEVYLDAPASINLIAVEFRYRASEISAWCAYNIGDRLNLGGEVEKNDLFQALVVFPVSRTCQQVRLRIGNPLETFAGHNILGIREVAIYSTSSSIALGKPVFTSDGTTTGYFGVDASTTSRWVSSNSAPVNYTVDLSSPVESWGCRMLWSSGLQPRTFSVMASNDTADWITLKSWDGNNRRDLYMVKRFVARYLMLQLESTAGNYFALRMFAVYNSPNLAINRSAGAERSWFHGGFEAVDGINTTFWVSEPFSTQATLSVDLLTYNYIGAGVHINWKFPAEDFQVWYSANLTEWIMLFEVEGNKENKTSIMTNFEARYVKLVMLRPSALNGDGSYAIYDLDVMFDPNLAHHKEISATHTIDQTQFIGERAIDGIRNTVWMPVQDSSSSELILDLTQDWVVSGYEIEWRHPPVTYSLDRQDVNTLEWKHVQRWTKQGYARNVGDIQTLEDGFTARRLRINIEEVEEHAEGLIVSLRDVLLHTFVNINKLIRQPVQASAEISGNPSTAAVDGNVKGTYWMPGENFKQAWLMITAATFLTSISVARTSIWWRWSPGTFNVEFFYEKWFVVHEETNSTETFTDFFFLRRMWKIRINILENYMNEDIGIFGVAVYPSEVRRPPAVEPLDQYWMGPVTQMNDLSTGSYWMGPPRTNYVEIKLDLGTVYDVFDIFVWFGFRSQGFELWTSVDGQSETIRPMTSTNIFGRLRLQERGVAFDCRYIRLWILKSYFDPENQLGTSIRDIAVYKFRNLARGENSTANSIWDYPANQILDGNTETIWASKFDSTKADILIDLGTERNVAGVSILFGWPARQFQLDFSRDNQSWGNSFQRFNNDELKVDITHRGSYFKARYVLFKMQKPATLLYDPDNREETARRPVFSLADFKLFEHTGGGGVVGIQNLDGTEFSTITYGLREPGEWIIITERPQEYTPDLNANPSTFVEDIRDVNRIPAVRTQLVVTFNTIRTTPDTRVLEIQLYRNGQPYGDRYTITQDRKRLVGINKTRLVIGVRSTIFTREREEWLKVARGHGITHSPYYAGRVFNVTLIKSALNQEEVRGLYQSTRGGQELGCHCYDACPTGRNRFFPDVPVPCSGQGACLRNPQGLPLGYGVCECMPGYSGDACELHCSELSKFGCCEVDDDCPTGIPCNTATKACTT